MTNPNIPPRLVMRYRMRRRRKKGIPPDYSVPRSVWRTMNAPRLGYADRLIAYSQYVESMPAVYRSEMYERWMIGAMIGPPLDKASTS